MGKPAIAKLINMALIVCFPILYQLHNITNVPKPLLKSTGRGGRHANGAINPGENYTSKYRARPCERGFPISWNEPPSAGKTVSCTDTWSGYLACGGRHHQHSVTDHVSLALLAG